MVSISNPFFSILIKSTENYLGDEGAKSLSDALKSNTTLTQLNLSGEDKRNNDVAPLSPILFTVVLMKMKKRVDC